MQLGKKQRSSDNDGEVGGGATEPQVPVANALASTASRLPEQLLGLYQLNPDAPAFVPLSLPADPVVEADAEALEEAVAEGIDEIIKGIQLETYSFLRRGENCTVCCRVCGDRLVEDIGNEYGDDLADLLCYPCQVVTDNDLTED